MQTFRTPNEAVELANNTGFGLAAFVWSESISLALEIAPRIKAGVVWINTANQFDASCGFGGHRESGFGRESGREGLREYLKPRKTAMSARSKPPRKPMALVIAQTNTIDRTAKPATSTLAAASSRSSRRC